ncbi:putative Alcohol dehydrogenase [Sorangium cellulosum So ce56]|uniref:Alcohol dehydrogenase n=1 Tax=Sorangium cellulosum (strain So ce56) TaxID=448385 RepID=A9GGZ8_SORC5|nr:putative Alcohol dehydrogenase [Sorangium cellulosum So ce56]
MKAAVYERYGSPSVLELREMPAPEPRDDQVRIRVHATTATAACQMMRRGDTLMARVVLGFFRPRRRFRVLGIEVAGTVERVGRRVTRFRPGDRVFGFTGFGSGGYAQYVCLSEDASIARAPAGLSHEEACSLVDGPTTALYFLRDRARLRTAERIAIVGASGSIGTAAVQIARHLGAEVTAVCSGRNAELVRSLGAHHVVDYTRDDYAARAGAFDVVFDTVGASSFARARRCLSRGGRYLITVGGAELYLRDAWSRIFGSRKLVFGMSVDKKTALPEVSELVARGALRPVIDRRYTLEAIADAHRYVETGRKRGNVVIEVGA